ncbi:MAG: phenylalanine--tRNA ligase subunit alpha, partial [Kiritimatiellia bacterium]|nr:phenylalanine--tRNA ligase subunit alpha [Kiritimatiellia bacterium]
MMDLGTIEQARAEALRDSAAADSLDALEAVRLAALGRKGKLPAWMEELKTAPREQKPEFGRVLNAFKTEVQSAVDRRRGELESAARPAEPFDGSLPGDWRAYGARHPISSIIERACGVFRTLGFTIADGPDIEDVFHNFDALNTPEDHPSRDPRDTFYLEDGHLLRCHTSPVQARYMEQ